MRKIKISLEYKCEINVSDFEAILVKKNISKFKNTEMLSQLSDAINEEFLLDDGRTEAGGVTKFDFVVEE